MKFIQKVVLVMALAIMTPTTGYAQDARSCAIAGANGNGWSRNYLHNRGARQFCINTHNKLWRAGKEVPNLVQEINNCHAAGIPTGVDADAFNRASKEANCQ